MGLLICGFLALGVALIRTAPDRIITAEDLSGCYASPPVQRPCERIVYRTGAMNAARTAAVRTSGLPKVYDVAMGSSSMARELPMTPRNYSRRAGASTRKALTLHHCRPMIE
jgi:hypothetical protein